MSRIYLSFLGLGSFNKEKGRHEYSPTVYELNGKRSGKTEFVQVAEMEILGPESFDQVVVVTTHKAYDANFNNLKDQLKMLGIRDIHPLIIEEDMSAEGQWRGFEKVLDRISNGDALTVDLTHGYRSIPIVFSTAVNFLQRAKGIELKGVYYGAYEKDRGLAPIIDMKEFYAINEWAEAVSRLVEDADAGKLARVSDRAADFQASELNDEKLVRAFQDLTDTIRNVDVNRVAERADTALRLIKEKESAASPTGRILMGLVTEKFASLADAFPISGKYDAAYFTLQLRIIGLLLDHKLFMQAFTAMRELVASIGMIQVENAKVSNAAGRKKRFRFGEVFVNMMKIPEDEWRFEKQAEEDKNRLLPYYGKLKDIGAETVLRGFSKKLADYRNGFDHAWTAKQGPLPDIEEKGREFLDLLMEVIDTLKEHGILFP